MSDMETRTATGLAIYNPDLLSRQELIEQFVARLPLLDRLLSGVRCADLKTPPQHHLIVAARGMGKTTLLRRLGYAIEDDPALSKNWLPLTFPEEQYNVSRLSDLWANCLDALGDALEELGHRQDAAELDRQIAALPPDDEEQRERQTLAMLRDWCGANRGLVLLLDNIDLVFDRLRERHWAIREVLSSTPGLLFVGASSAAMEATYTYDAAFYDFFRIEELRGLSETESREMLLNLARLRNDPAVRQVVEHDPGRFRALHLLTGGNPRTILLLYSVLAFDGGQADVHVDLERLLDHCTPLYKARFEAMSAQAQQLVDGIALHWDPISAAGLAEAVRLDVNKVSSQLNRLVRQGVIEKVPLPPGKRHGFQISERFYNIWYLMRASRRVRRRLVWLVEFLRLFYGRKELQRRARSLVHEPESSQLHGHQRHAELALAYAQSVDDHHLSRALDVTGLELLLDADERPKLARLFDFDGDDAELKSVAKNMETMRKVRDTIINADRKWPSCPAEELWDLFGGAPGLSPSQKLAWAQLLVTAEDQFVDSVTKALRDLHSATLSAFGPWATEQFRKALQRGLMAREDDIAGSDAAALRLEAQALRAASRLAEMLTDGSSDSVNEVEGILAKVPLEQGSPYLWRSLGDGARLRNRNEKAEACYRRAIGLDESLAIPWRHLGYLLHYELGRYEDAEAAYRRAIELDASDAKPWINLGNLLQDHLSRYEESEAAYRRAIELDDRYAATWYSLGKLLDRIGRRQEAEEASRRAVTLEPESSRYLNRLAWSLFVADGDLDEAGGIASKAVRLAPEDPLYLHTLAQIRVRKGEWGEGAETIRLLLGQADDEFCTRYWDDVTELFRNAVQIGHAVDAVALIDETGHGERWRPLREALQASAENDPAAYLLRVAPEVRQPAQEILKQLLVTGISSDLKLR